MNNHGSIYTTNCIRTKWYEQNCIRTKLHWTKWYGQNAIIMNKIVYDRINNQLINRSAPMHRQYLYMTFCNQSRFQFDPVIGFLCMPILL